VKRALVTGGTGFVGSHLVDALLASGTAVTCTVRPTSDTRWLKGTGAQLVPCRLDDQGDLRKALVGVDLVYHVAGGSGLSSTAEFDYLNTELTRSVITACADAPKPPRLLYVSSLAAAGPSETGMPRSEEMPPAPISDYGRSKLAAEGVVQGFADRVQSTIVRPPVVYGPRDSATLNLFKLARLPLRPGVGANKPMSMIHVGDLVRGILVAADNDGTVGQTFFLAHPEPLTMGQLGRMLAQAQGKQGWTFPAPDPAIKVAALASEGFGRLFRRRVELNRDRAREITQPGWVCSPEKAERELGFRATVDHGEGLKATARWYAEAGWL
jgi:dihydroflavonol-4-reductase